MCVTPKKVLYPSQWRTECPPERFVEGVGCATRGNSLRVAQVMWLRGGCGGCCVRHCLGKRRGVGLHRHSSGDQVLMIHCNQTKVCKEPNID